MRLPSNKRKARVLTGVKVHEISVVDKGAGEGCHVVLRKNHGYPPELCRAFAKNTDVPVDPDGPINPGGDDSDGTRIERGFDDDDEAVRLNADADDDQCDEDDRECEDFEKGETTMQLIDLAKRHGWRTVCKNFVERGSAADMFSETEVTALLTAVARKSYPDLKPDVAFAKAYSAQTADGELMRRTTQAARDAGFASRTSTVKGGSSPHFHAGDDNYFGPAGSPGRATLTPRLGNPKSVNNPKSALAALRELADEQRRQNPSLSEAGAFARVYEDRSNADLVRREREENRPRAW